MDFTMTKPCAECPFLKEGGIRLKRGRVIEIGGMMLQPSGGTFPCHKTVTFRDIDETDEAAERLHQEDERHCAGALIFAEKNGNATQMMRICERLGLYDPAKLMSDQAVIGRVVNDLAEMLAVNEKAASK